MSHINKYFCAIFFRKVKSRLSILMLVSLMLKGEGMMLEAAVVDFLFAMIMILLRYISTCFGVFHALPVKYCSKACC